MNKTICLVSTYHDPEGNYSYKFLEKDLPIIMDLFDRIVVVVTNNTSQSIIDLFRKSKVNLIKTNPGQGAGSRLLGLKSAIATKQDYFLNLDFDRLMYWLEKKPDELKRIIKRIRNSHEEEFLAIGRTIKAWNTHPEYQKSPEKRTNETLSIELGKKIDVTTGCYSFSGKTARAIVREAKGMTSGVTDIEWLMVAKLFSQAEINTIFVDGLGWETNYIFGPERASNPNGKYEITREKMADKTIAMIEQVKSRYQEYKVSTEVWI